MSNNNKKHDVFKSFLVQNASYAGNFEIPILQSTSSIPLKVIPFSKAISSNEYDAWIVFYENDDKFVRIWNNPKRYLSIIKKFKGVISPDFSVYRNMPLSMQVWSTYQGKALAHFWQENEIDVIPNVRFGDKRTFEFCFDGVPKNSVVAVGTHGCIKSIVDRMHFKIGLAQMVKVLVPHTIIVYGTAPPDIFGEYQRHGIDIVQFNSHTSKYFISRKEVI